MLYGLVEGVSQERGNLVMEGVIFGWLDTIITAWEVPGPTRLSFGSYWTGSRGGGGGTEVRA